MMEEYELPPNWMWAKLEDLGPILSGGTPKTSDPSNFDGDIPWITPADLTGYSQKTISRGRKNLAKRGLENSSARIIQERAVLFSSRAPIGYVAIAANALTTNQGFKSVAVSEEIDENFVYFYLRSAKHLAEKNASGTTFREISGSRFAQLPVPVAPLNEQRRIVEKIETLFARLDKGEEALREVQTLLTRYRQSVLKAAVTGQLTSSRVEDWHTVTLGPLLEDIRYGTAKKCHHDSEGVGVLRIPNVVSGEIDCKDLKFTELDEKEMSKLALRRGDLLMVRSNGSANLVARSVVVGEEAVGLAFAGYLIRLRVDQKRLLPDFLHLILESPIVRSKIERQARSTSGVHNINSGEVKAITFDLPPVDHQAEIVERFDEQMSKINALETWCETELARSKALRQSILKDAFAGRLVPQDPADEPAADLLARIKHSRAATSDTPRRKVTV